MSEVVPWFMHNVDDDVSRYFRELGYCVRWDFAKSDGARWYEIEDATTRRRVIQIDMGVPLAHIIEDMIAWHEGREATSASDYEMRGPITEEVRALYAAVATRETA